VTDAGFALYFLIIFSLPYLIVFILPVIFLQYGNKRGYAFLYILGFGAICLLDININFDDITYPHFMLGFFVEFPVATFVITLITVFYAGYKFFEPDEY
jgi:hypothetical protein